MKTAPHLIPTVLLAAFFAMTCLFSAAAPDIAFCAEAPLPNSQGKGVYRMMVGDFAVIALSDGANSRSVEQQLQLLNGNKEKIKDSLVRAYPDEQIKSSVNAYLINTGSKLVLVDTGNGRMGSPTMGNVIDNLRAAGYQPESIDEIYLTHMHADHIGGLVSEAERAFPNATVHASKIEADYWLNDGNLDAAPADVKRTFQAAKTAITPYIYAGKFKTFTGDALLATGIRAEALSGHTPGHTAYFIESKGQTLVLWGDIIHVAAVQFAEPAVTIAYDSDKTAAANARRQILAAAAKNGWLIGGAHLSFPGFGHVRAGEGDGFVFVPLD